MLKAFSDWVTYRILHISQETLLAKAVNFFIYDTIKIFLLLIIIIFTIAVVRSFLPPERIRFILSRKNKYLGNILAALLGIITPFCSCSAVPLFLGFIRSGVPLGVTFSFLVSSPMINEVALVLLFGLFGFKIAFIYVISGLIIAIISGIVIGKLKVEHLLTEITLSGKAAAQEFSSTMSWPERITYARSYTLDILNKVWPYILIGVGIGAWIHGYVPVGFLAKYAGADKWYAVPFATLIGIPLYSNAAGVIPLVSALTEKGVAMGTTLAFMMAVTALSLPEFMILKTVMKTKLIAIFAGIVGIGIVFTGYLFNFILK
ncbi:MAG: permease [Elusimicrobia bacterium]|nr:permease [Candidatus Liberimonas magnetica]